MRNFLHAHPDIFQTLNREELIEVVLFLQKLAGEFENASRHDHLTGLRNRRGFEEKARAKLESRNHGHWHHRKAEEISVALLFVDIDHFKKINDKHGHSHGDEVLQVISETIKRSVRSDDIDIVGRWGGEEIVVCLPGMDSCSAAKKAEAIRASIAELSFMSEEGNFGVTVSIGICSTEEVGYDLGRLEKAADKALYKAKRGGRNRVVLYASPKN